MHIELYGLCQILLIEGCLQLTVHPRNMDMFVFFLQAFVEGVVACYLCLGSSVQCSHTEHLKKLIRLS